MFSKTFSYPDHEIIRQVRDAEGRKFRKKARIFRNRVVLVQTVTPWGTLVLNVETYDGKVTTVNGEMKHFCCRNVYRVNTDNYEAHCKKCKKIVPYYSPGEITLYVPYMNVVNSNNYEYHRRFSQDMADAKNVWIKSEDGIEKFYLEELFERELETFFNDYNEALTQFQGAPL